MELRELESLSTERARRLLQAGRRPASLFPSPFGAQLVLPSEDAHACLYLFTLAINVWPDATVPMLTLSITSYPRGRINVNAYRNEESFVESTFLYRIRAGHADSRRVVACAGWWRSGLIACPILVLHGGGGVGCQARAFFAESLLHHVREPV